MRYLVMVSAVLALGLAAGCTRSQNAAVRQQVQGLREQVGSAAESAKKAAAEATLAAKVKSALATRKGLEGTDINVEAHGSTIVLKGDVSSRAQAEQAERVAIETEGVESVDNRLTMRIPAKAVSRPGPRG